MVGGLYNSGVTDLMILMDRMRWGWDLQISHLVSRGSGM
jgi:hypothetical protein